MYFLQVPVQLNSTKCKHLMKIQRTDQNHNTQNQQRNQLSQNKRKRKDSRWILSSDHQFHFHSREDDFSVRLDRGGPGTGWLTAQPIPNIIGFLLSQTKTWETTVLDVVNFSLLSAPSKPWLTLVVCPQVVFA